jgi:hypothetical protein
MPKDEKKKEEKKEYIGQETFPTLWIWACVLANMIGILSVIMLIIAELVLIGNDFTNYVDQYGHSYRECERRCTLTSLTDSCPALCWRGGMRVCELDECAQGESWSGRRMK